MVQHDIRNIPESNRCSNAYVLSQYGKIGIGIHHGGTMPQKIRQLKAALSKAGFSQRKAKGSHTVWKHPALPRVSVTVSGKDGNDAKPYQVDEVEDALTQLRRKNENASLLY